MTYGAKVTLSIDTYREFIRDKETQKGNCSISTAHGLDVSLRDTRQQK